jgi:hypothetical protein
MEITLLTRNGITPNPTVEFLELCQKAVNYCKDKSLDNCIDLHASVNTMSTSDNWLHVEQYNRYGITTFSIGCSEKESGTMFYFESHQLTQDGFMLDPTITESSYLFVGNE